MSLIEVADLAKDYVLGDSIVHALDGVTLSIDAGEFVAVMGPSGSGKSTFMNLIGCLDRPSRGGYRLAGEDVAAMDADDLAAIRNRRIGFVFQQFNLLARTSAQENVELPLMYAGRTGTRGTARAALERVGLGDRLRHEPSQLSGGQRQRVAVARALVTDPVIVLADEPTANLDSTTGEAIVALMEEINRRDGTTFIFSTHDPRVMGRARRVLRLADGRLEA